MLELMQAVLTFKPTLLGFILGLVQLHRTMRLFLLGMGLTLLHKKNTGLLEILGESHGDITDISKLPEMRQIITPVSLCPKLGSQHFS